MYMMQTLLSDVSVSDVSSVNSDDISIPNMSALLTVLMLSYLMSVLSVVMT